MATLTTGTLDFSGLVDIEKTDTYKKNKLIILEIEKQINNINKNQLRRLNKHINYCKKKLNPDNNLPRENWLKIKESAVNAENLCGPSAGLSALQG